MKSVVPELILIFYDFPQVFVAKDVVDLRYLCMVIDVNEFAIEYLCIPISLSRINKLSVGDLDLRDAFLTPETNEFFSCTSEGGRNDLNLQKLSYFACPTEFLPEEGITFDEYDEVASKAFSLNSTISYASLSVPEASHLPRIRTIKLAEFLTLYQNSLKYLTKLIAKSSKRAVSKGNEPFNTDIIGFSYGSFTVQLSSSSKGDLLGDNALLAGAFEKLTTFLLLSSNTSEALKFLQTMKGHTAGSLIKLLEFMIEHSCPLKHQWATPSMGVSEKATVSLEDAMELLKICKQRDELFREEINLVGIFTIANSDANTWKLTDENGQSYSGSVHRDSNVTMHGIVIREKKYKIVCEERIEIVIGTSEEVKKLLITDLKEA